MKYLLIIVSLFFSVKAVTQTQWKEFTFDRFGSHLAISGNDLWVGTNHGGVYKWNTITNQHEKFTRVNNGLSGNSINDLVIDANQNIWVATDHGLSMYNGVSWTVYDSNNSGLSDNIVTSLGIDINGIDVWIGTYQSGLFKYDGNNWTNYHTNNSNISDNFINSLKITLNGDIWLGHTLTPVDKFDGTTWTNYSPGFAGTSRWIKATDSNNVWIWSYGEVLGGYVADIKKFDGTNWTTYTLANSGIISDLVSGIDIDTNNDVWFSTDGGVSKLNGSNWTNYTNILSSANPNYANPNRLVIDSNNEIWFGTDFGISKFNNGNFSNYSTNEIDDLHNSDIEIDQNNTKWIANRNGLHKYDGNWQIFNTNNSPIPSNDIKTVEIDLNQDIWVGSHNEGVSKFDGTNWFTYNTGNSGIHSDQINEISIDLSGTKWFCSGLYSTNISKFDGTNWTIYPLNATTICMNIDTTNGDIWFGTYSGAIKFDGINWTTYDTSNGLISNTINSISFDLNGDIWFGTNQGISVYNGTNWTNYTTANGLADNWVNDIFIDNNGIKWIATHINGMSKFDGANWQNFNWSDGLIDNRIFKIAADSYGNIWIAANLGISQFNENGIITLGTSSKTIETEFESVFPNPTSGIVELKISNLNDQGFELILSDIQGTLVYTKRYSSSELTKIQLDLSNQSSGIYFLTIKNDSPSFKTYKIIKY